jgi:hypothetical protein
VAAATPTPDNLGIQRQIELCPFGLRDERTGKWIRARYLAERHEREQRYLRTSRAVVDLHQAFQRRRPRPGRTSARFAKSLTGQERLYAQVAESIR